MKSLISFPNGPKEPTYPRLVKMKVSRAIVLLTSESYGTVVNVTDMSKGFHHEIGNHATSCGKRGIDYEDFDGNVILTNS